MSSRVPCSRPAATLRFRFTVTSDGTAGVACPVPTEGVSAPSAGPPRLAAGPTLLSKAPRAAPSLRPVADAGQGPSVAAPGWSLVTRWFGPFHRDA